MRRASDIAGGMAMAALGVFGLTGASASTHSEPVPRCQRVLITTPYRSFQVKACDSGLRQPAPGKQWQWVVDGSALKGGAVIFGFQVPKQGG